MAVEILAFPSAASASFYKGGDGELVLDSIQYQSNLTLLGSDLFQNGEAKFQREIDRILKTILLKVSPIGCSTTSTPVDVVEHTVPVVKFPDGGHRCPYFPCPTCHRTRSIFGPMSSRPRASNCKSVTHPALIDALIEEDGVTALEKPSAISNLIPNETRESRVPVVGFPDGGHRCPYFPCPTCHRTRRLLPDAERRCMKVSFLNFNCISNLSTCESEGRISSHRVRPALIMYPDKGHKCEEFPCPICHKKDRSGRNPALCCTKVVHVTGGDPRTYQAGKSLESDPPELHMSVSGS